MSYVKKVVWAEDNESSLDCEMAVQRCFVCDNKKTYFNIVNKVINDKVYLTKLANAWNNVETLFNKMKWNYKKEQELYLWLFRSCRKEGDFKFN